jgi:hypothetical protein
VAAGVLKTTIWASAAVIMLTIAIRFVWPDPPSRHVTIAADVAGVPAAQGEDVERPPAAAPASSRRRLAAPVIAPRPTIECRDESAFAPALAGVDVVCR